MGSVANGVLSLLTKFIGSDRANIRLVIEWKEKNVVMDAGSRQQGRLCLPASGFVYKPQIHAQILFQCLFNPGTDHGGRLPA